MLKILLIEDNLDHAILAKSALISAFNNEVLIQHKCKISDALEYMNSTDVIISDLMLADGRGFETVTKLIGHLDRNIPLIVLTSKEDYELGRKAVTLGAQDYLVKGSLSPESLRRCIEFSMIRKKYESKLLNDREDAFKELDKKSNFLAQMNHEMRTPLNCIIGLSDLVLSELQNLSLDEIRSSMKSINNSSNLLLSLINNSLDLAKIEANEVKLNIEKISTRKFLSDITGIIEYSIQEKGNQLKIIVDSEVAMFIYIDHHRLSQVLINILNNANKFTHNGIITLVLKNNSHNQFYLDFEIHDTGRGIDPSMLNTIFSPYKQDAPNLHSDLSDYGTGLGLTICQKLVNLMGGLIRVQSELGKGSMFYFSLPSQLSDPSTVDSNQRSELKKSDLTVFVPNIKILSVDDSLGNQNLIHAYTKSLNVKVVYAYNGAEALEKYKHESFDLVLMDMQMPVLNGYETVYEMRRFEQLEGLRNVPIIAVSSNTESENIRAAMKVGCNEYVCRPIKRKPLFEILKKYIKSTDNDFSACDSLRIEQGKSQILLIDDNVEILELLKKVLKSDKFEIISTESPLRALKLMEHRTIDVVIADYLMPEMNGLDLYLKSLEKQLIRPESFYISSGYPEDVSKEIKRKNLNVEILSKPFDINYIKSQLQKIS